MDLQINMKKIKNRKNNVIDMFFYLQIDGNLNVMQFHYYLLVYQTPPKYYAFYNGFNLTVFNGLSNDNEITLNLNHHQSISRRANL
jgi:hypothetical protein